MDERILEELFGLGDARVDDLEGYDNRNLLVSSGGSKFVLKISDPLASNEEELAGESRILLALSGEGIRGLPRPVRDIEGRLVSPAVVDGQKRLLRLFDYVEGSISGREGNAAELQEPLGRFLGRLDQALSGLRETAIQAKRSPWDLQNWALTEADARFIADPRGRKLVDYFFLRARQFVDPKIPGLRRQLIHGDANEWNVLIGNDGEVSLIDFGDLCHSPLVNELAIAACYVVLQSDDPVTGALPLIRSYCSVNPLTEEEISLLFDLIAIRASISVCRSARARTEMPENEYAQISDRPAWEFLKKWSTVNPVRAENAFREAAGFGPRPEGSASEDLEVRQRNTSRALSLQFEEPIRMESAAFQHMFDREGRTYLDCYNNIPHVGHCHPRVVGALARSSLKLNTNTRYLTRELNEYSSRLLGLFPKRLDKVFFVNSGSAATDLALRLAFAHTGRECVVVMEHGYHGNTRMGIAVSHYKYAGKGGPGKQENIIEAPIPNILRAGDAERDFLEELRSRTLGREPEIAALIAEPIVGCGGQVPLPGNYMREAFRHVKSVGGVSISDEVQTGFGRLGEWFWGFEMHGADPDIVILGKPIGNGHPMAAVVTTSEIARSFETGMEFFSSFGGNTVSCAVGNAVLDVIEDERLQENAAVVGKRLLEGLRGLVGRFESCGDARGSGLFLGLELVKNAPEPAPDTALASRVKNRLKEKGILVGTDGPHDNVIKIKPPLCFTAGNADELLAALEAAISDG